MIMVMFLFIYSMTEFQLRRELGMSGVTVTGSDKECIAVESGGMKTVFSCGSERIWQVTCIYSSLSATRNRFNPLVTVVILDDYIVFRERGFIASLFLEK